MATQFPRTTVEGLSLSRYIIGTNWIGGWGHRSVSADKMIKEFHATSEQSEKMLKAYLEYGIDTVMALMNQVPSLCTAIRNVQEETGREIIVVDTPTINTEDSKEGRAEARARIQASAKEYGAKVCLIHHSSVEKLVDKQSRTIRRLDDYTEMIRDAGMIPGLSCHMPECVVYSDLNNYDVQTYIQIYNCMGFLMQSEIETVNHIIRDAKKPVMTIKPMAAGRTTPFVGLNFSWNTIRDCDMVTVGCLNEREVREDIEISLAALERRAANIEKRSSPNMDQDAFGVNGAHR